MNGDESECSVKKIENREITEEWRQSFSTGNNTQHQLQLILAMIGSPPDEFVRASSPRPSKFNKIVSAFKFSDSSNFRILNA